MTFENDFRKNGPMSQIAAKLAQHDRMIRDLMARRVASSWELIRAIDLTAPAASFDFQGLSDTYKHLKILLTARSERVGIFDGVNIIFNGDLGNNYVGRLQWATGSNEQPAAGAPFTIAYTSGATSPANTFSNAEITIYDYKNTNIYKTIQSRGGDIENQVAGNLYIYDGVLHWLSLSAINQVTLYSPFGTNYSTYSSAYMYALP